jgi:hypothetical protein
VVFRRKFAVGRCAQNARSRRPADRPIRDLVRNCERCGYLLPEVWDTCRKCGAPVATGGGVTAGVAPAATGAGAAASWARPPVAPGPPAAAPPAPVGRAAGAVGAADLRYAAPVRLGFGDGDGDAGAGTAAGVAGRDDPRPGGWGPPPVVAAPRPGASRAPAKLVSLLLVAGLAAGGWFGWKLVRPQPRMAAETKAFVDGAGIDYEPFGMGYSVRLPRQPVATSQTVGAGGMTVTLNVALIEEEEWEVGVAVADLGFEVTPDMVDQVFAQGIEGAAAETGGEVVGEERITFAGRPAVDAEFEAPDGYPARALIVIDGNRLYMVLAHAAAGTEAIYDEMVDSFRIGGAGAGA